MPKTPSPRGRKPILSREKIIDRALTLLRELPPHQFSLRRLAQSLDITPTALYAYFDGLEELYKAAAMAVTNGIDLSALEEAGHWREGLRQWAHAVRKQHLQYPHIDLLMQLTPHVPPAWYRVILPVLRILQEAGLEGEELILTFRTFIRTVAGLVLVELQHDKVMGAAHKQHGREAMDAMSSGDRLLLAGLLPQIGSGNSELLFEQSLEILLDGIAGYIPATQRNPQRRVTKKPRGQ